MFRMGYWFRFCGHLLPRQHMQLLHHSAKCVEPHKIHYCEGLTLKSALMKCKMNYRRVRLEWDEKCWNEMNVSLFDCITVTISHEHFYQNIHIIKINVNPFSLEIAFQFISARSILISTTASIKSRTWWCRFVNTEASFDICRQSATMSKIV